MPETVLDLYARYRRDLYDPVFCMMIRGLRVDLDAMISETARLTQERDAAKKRLDDATSAATDGTVVPLYKTDSHLNPAFLQLQDDKKQWKIKSTLMRKAKNKEKANEYRDLYKAIDAQTKSMRAEGTHKIESRGDGLSNDKIKAFFYGRMKCPKHLKDKKLTADEAALLKIKEQRPALIPVIDLILDHRHIEKMMQYVNPEKVDADGRLRFSFNVSGTVTDRFSSSANPRSTGYNIQNVSGELHHIFLPDRGYFFLSCDASQIEDRLVKIRTHHPNMIELARKKPWEFDAHRHTAAMMFNKDITTISSEERQLAKVVNHACMDDESEVLTRDGWKRFPYLMLWEEAAQWEPEGRRITFVKPEIHKYDYDGDLIRIRGGGIAQRVTPPHRMPYYTNDAFHVAIAAEVPKGARFPINGYYEGGSITLGDPIIRLMAAFQADATLSGMVCWHLKKERKITRLLALLSDAGMPYSKTDNADGTVAIRVSLVNFCVILHFLPDKRFSGRLLQLTAKNLDVLLDELQHWDGGSQHNCNAVLYRSSDPQNIAWVQTIAHLRGKQARVSKSINSPSSFNPGGETYSVSINDFQHALIPRLHKEPYCGTVWCLTVPSGFFMTRRNGVVSVTGNSERCMQEYTMADHLLEAGYKKTPSECRILLDLWNSAHVPILEWQHRTRMHIIQQTADRRRMYSSWGRYIDFCYEQLGDSLYRDAISWMPQHECVMLINQYGLIPIWRLIERDGRCDDPLIIEAIRRLIENEKIDASTEYYVNKRSYRSFISAQIHDEVLAQCPWDDLDEAYGVMVFLRASIEREREYAGLALSVPVEFSVGAKCWAKDLSWKKMPSRAEFKEAMIELKAEKGAVV